MAETLLTLKKNKTVIFNLKNITEIFKEVGYYLKLQCTLSWN